MDAPPSTTPNTRPDTPDAPQRTGRSDQEHERRSQAIDQFQMIARFSHEIRSPVHTILGIAESLADSPDLSAETRDHIGSILSETNALQSMIDDVLDVSKLTAGQMELASDVFSPATVVDDVGRSFGLECAKKGLEFAIRVDAGIPSRVKGDQTRVRQVLVNLVANAVQNTDTGFVRLEAVQNDDGSVRFCVSDSGPGIPSDVRSTIFEPFTRTADQSVSGCGLGLAITKRLVELMDGSLGFETGENGTSFWCDLAFGHARRATDLQPDPAPTVVPAVSGCHVLVVDDSEVNRLLAASQLERLGYSFTTVQSGEEALEKLETGSFDAVLMDWHMPGLDGLEATRQWRARETREPPLPIISMTASAMAGDRERCLDAGASDYLSKPVSISDLGSMLSRWTGPRSSGTSGATELMYDATQIDALIRDLGDVTVVCSILEAFLDMVPQYRASTTSGLERNDRVSIKRAAHTLKSTAAMLGADDLADACLQLEQIADDDTQDLDPLVATFDRRCSEAETGLGQLLATLRDQPTAP